MGPKNFLTLDEGIDLALRRLDFLAEVVLHMHADLVALRVAAGIPGQGCDVRAEEPPDEVVGAGDGG